MTSTKIKILSLFERSNSSSTAKRKFHFWRLFYIACAEIFGYDNGNEWVVSHHLFKKSEKPPWTLEKALDDDYGIALYLEASA